MAAIDTWIFVWMAATIALIISWSDIMALMGELGAASDKLVQRELGIG